MPPGERRNLGLFGLFDVDDLDVQIRVRVAIHELERRRPDLTVRLFAPFGATRPLPVFADLAVEPLAPAGIVPGGALSTELAGAVVVGSTAVDGADLYRGHPEVDPRDVTAALDLIDAPLEPARTAPDPVEPHPALLARRVWSFGVCEQRREFLRAMHWWPQQGAALVIAGTDAHLEHVETLASRLRLGDREITVVGIGRGDDEFSAALAARLRRARLMPADRSSIDDRVAAIAGAASVVSGDPAVLAVADAFGRPRRPIDVFAESSGTRAARRGAATVARDETRLDRAYDELAALAPGELTPLLASGEITALRVALDAQARRAAHERVVLADYVRAVRNNAAHDVAELRVALADQPLRRLRGLLRPQRSNDSGANDSVNVTPPLVSVCMVTYGARDWVERTLDALVASTPAGRYEIVVVDNGSDDGTDEFVRRFSRTAPVPIRVECCGRNLGFAAGNDLAANLAHGAVLCFLNTDVLVPEGWLDALVAPLLRDPAIAVTVPLFVGTDGRLQEAGTNVEPDGRVEAFGIRADPDDPEWSWPRRVTYGSAACWMVRTAAFRQVGGFDAGYGVAYYEDADCAFELARAGMRIELVPSVRVVHAQGASSPSSDAAVARRDANKARFVARQQALLGHRWHTLDIPNEPHRYFAARDVDMARRVLVVADTLPAVESIAPVAADARVTVATRAGGDAATLRGHGVEVVGDPEQAVRDRLFLLDEVIAPQAWLDAHEQLLGECQPQAAYSSSAIEPSSLPNT